MKRLLPLIVGMLPLVGVGQNYNIYTGKLGDTAQFEQQVSGPVAPNRSATYFGQSECQDMFFTIDLEGNIRSWSLGGGQITGGDTIITTQGRSLAYCASNGSMTYYTQYFMENGLSYYNGQDWTFVASPFNYGANNGGYGTDQYLQNGIRTVSYFDGTDFDSIYSVPPGHYISVFDMAVDTLGHAWVFYGTGPDTIMQLDVIDPSGSVLQSYGFAAATNNAYGSFFLNGTLYVGYGSGGIIPNAIVPVTLNGANAQYGAPIPFPDQDFQDLASCQSLGVFLRTDERRSVSNDLAVYPNPATTTIRIQLPEGVQKATSTTIYDMQGRLVHQQPFATTMDVSTLSRGTYAIVVQAEEGNFRTTIQKQ